jgi:hypothetical protein
MRDEVNDRAILKGGPKGSKPFLKAYPAALTWVIQELSDAAFTELEDLAETWNLSGPPADVQTK